MGLNSHFTSMATQTNVRNRQTGSVTSEVTFPDRPTRDLNGHYTKTAVQTHTPFQNMGGNKWTERLPLKSNNFTER